jgi:hypothetical protein
MILKR